jgi:hypothetical protein
MAVAANVGFNANPPLQLMNALAGLRAGLVLAVHTVVLARASSHAAVSTATASASPPQLQRCILVCSGIGARRLLMRALDAFEPRTGERLVVEGLPRGTTADDVTQLLRCLCADVRPIDVSVTADVAPDAATGCAGVGCTAVITCCRLSGDIDSVVAALHGKRLGGTSQPLCVYPLELQHTQWAPNPSDL